MSPLDDSSWTRTIGETPTVGIDYRHHGYAHGSTWQYCAQFQSLLSEVVNLDPKYTKEQSKPEDQAVAQAPKLRLAELYDSRFKRVDAWRAIHGLVPSLPLDLKTKAPSISSNQKYELADATVRRELELLTMFDGKENDNLEATTSHSPPFVPEGYVPVPILETAEGRFISVLEKQEAFVPK